MPIQRDAEFFQRLKKEVVFADRLRSRGPLLKATRSSWSFTEIMEIRILGRMEKPTGINARPERLVHSAEEAGEWQTQQDENEARIRP